jgi:hypothetical protein
LQENGATQNIGGKMIPQLEAQTATDTLKIFFFEPVRNMASFSEKEKLSFDWPIKIQSTVKSFLLTENWLII